MARGFLWRGGLPPLGCEAVLKPATVLLREKRISWITNASRPNGGKPLATKSHHSKPPRHKVIY
ncbi:hypothetical protein PS691_04614 [Pseudomonas fluorescens]|uniref:Uncharacterized protein n=1 Tax=Pseudomonas fluorescens TaxID=294 RepID=A0A5E7EIS1_PSEFL|nr:hypothetical protein PS691_04614 [Pseudomonas fluorescens]